MDFNSATNYLLSLQKLPRKEYMRDPNHCAIYLKRLQFFLNLLGNPEKKIHKYIHITGTSGKGSVTSFLHNILYSNGYKVGSTQSPHPSRITERWKIDNKQINKKEFVNLVKLIQPKLDEYTKTTPYDYLSFFEVIEAIGFLFFAKNNVDWAILEVGCGGRFDSSNIIPSKKLAVITNIGLDHVGVIGNNKKEITWEKAGIINKNCIVLTGEKNKELIKIMKKQSGKNKLITVGYKYKIIKQDLSETVFQYSNEIYKIKMIGNHQVENAILAIESAKQLGISSKAIKHGLAKTKIPLRMQIIKKQPLVIVDSAHNPDKIKATVKTIKSMPELANKKVCLLTGFSADKDIKKMVNILKNLNLKFVACTRFTNNALKQPADPRIIAKHFQSKKKQTETKIFLDPLQALDWTQKKTKKNELLLITGSFYLSGQLNKTL